MKKQIENAHVEIEDLEKLGWELDIDNVDRTEWHVIIRVTDEGTTMWDLCDRFNNAPYHPEETGDDEMTMQDLDRLQSEGKLWDVEYK